ncbi:MAG: GDSL family lipase [Spirochaetaceae bacterium]|nr:MAG: GDSL family lipase [Spirochaetaceae bacterium]
MVNAGTLPRLCHRSHGGCMTTIVAGEVLFQGAVSFDRTAEGLAPVRLPVAQAGLFPSPDDMLMQRAWSPSGVRLRFATDSSRLRVSIVPADTGEEQCIFDLSCGARILDSRTVAPGSDQVDFRLDPSSGNASASGNDLPVYEIWLHQWHPTRVSSLQIDDGARFALPPDDRPRWVAYGSSISMCRTAASPARTWPAVAAREHGLALTSLGFGGQCHLDPLVGMVLRDLPADLMTLKLGINVYGGGSLNVRSYPAAVIGLVRIIRERHPRIPIGVITSIISPDRERTPNAVGCTLEDYRAMTRDAVERLRRAGDETLLLFEGTDLFGEADAQLLPDGLHPNPEGYELIGKRVAELVLPALIR